jgi:hypothetical protein
MKKKKKNLIACRGLCRVVGPLLAARALPLRCAASTMLSSTLRPWHVILLHQIFREFVLETSEQLSELNLLGRCPGGGLAAASLFGLTANLLRCFVEQEPSKAIQQAVLLRESAF